MNKKKISTNSSSPIRERIIVVPAGRNRSGSFSTNIILAVIGFCFSFCSAWAIPDYTIGGVNISLGWYICIGFLILCAIAFFMGRARFLFAGAIAGFIPALLLWWQNIQIPFLKNGGCLGTIVLMVAPLMILTFIFVYKNYGGEQT